MDVNIHQMGLQCPQFQGAASDPGVPRDDLGVVLVAIGPVIRRLSRHCSNRRESSTRWFAAQKSDLVNQAVLNRVDRDRAKGVPVATLDQFLVDGMVSDHQALE
jgi:hypothetical protein